MKQTVKNRIVLITGDGKGKTTAALGMVLRAVGHGLRVCVVQFIKRRSDTGEMRALAVLHGVELHLCGEGFVLTKAGPVFEAHVRAAEAGLLLAAEKLNDPAYGMVVLDEVCGAVAEGLLTAPAVRTAIGHAAPRTVVVLTGRDACQELVDLADTVSRIDCVKHGMADGWLAQEGVEW
ncbi:MAG: cob(I)yrinic acid a,c-diamide adenosyltransferase [bacterium]